MMTQLTAQRRGSGGLGAGRSREPAAPPVARVPRLGRQAGPTPAVVPNRFFQPRLAQSWFHSAALEPRAPRKENQ
jgi:hypothetical protein